MIQPNGGKHEHVQQCLAAFNLTLQGRVRAKMRQRGKLSTTPNQPGIKGDLTQGTSPPSQLQTAQTAIVLINPRLVFNSL